MDVWRAAATRRTKFSTTPQPVGTAARVEMSDPVSTAYTLGREAIAIASDTRAQIERRRLIESHGLTVVALLAAI